MREIKFRSWNPDNKKMYYDFDQNIQEITIGQSIHNYVYSIGLIYRTLMQFTGLKDKNGVECYEGDIVRYRIPYRTMQTHTGDNIPNGSYTEPMEPAIKTVEGEIIFKNGMFLIDIESEFDCYTYPMYWSIRIWSLEEIKETISWNDRMFNLFDDPEEGDLEYLITECAKVRNSEELIEYLNGFEIIGNIHQNPELL